MSNTRPHNHLPVEPMGVDNPTFMLTLESENCPPLQFLREFTVNGIEAIDAYRRDVEAGYHGEVIWTVDEDQLRESGRRKLCCVDTGIGMSGDELRLYINNLASSGKEQAIDKNYGIGAKVSAAARNAHGTMYRSWKDGRGSMAILRYDSVNEKWGLHLFEDFDGDVKSVRDLGEDEKPTALAGIDHGTVVTFFGHSDDEDTTLPPEEDNREKWITKALNQRFYDLPDYVTVRAREERENEEVSHRTVRGQRYYLDRHTVAAGAVPVRGAVIHWRILDEAHEERRKQGSSWASTGHRAALHRNELYELTTMARGAVQRLQEFGVRFGHRHVVIYAEPDHTAGKLTVNPARTQLKIEREPLPWLRYGAEFEAKMPVELGAFQEVFAGGDRDHDKSIRDRLQAIAELFKVPRYKPAPDGKVTVDQLRLGGSAERIDEDTHASPEDQRPTGGGSAGRVYSMFEKRRGEPAKRADPDTLPEIEVDWISAKDGTRAAGEDLEDLAADFDRRHAFLRINADFRGYRGMVDRWVKRYRGVTGAERMIEEQVREWWQQSLTETVLGVLALRGSAVWNDRRVEEALSPTALTAAVMQRYHLDATLRRELGRVLKPLREVA